jgi:hypothetical protein
MMNQTAQSNEVCVDVADAVSMFNHHYLIKNLIRVMNERGYGSTKSLKLVMGYVMQICHVCLKSLDDHGFADEVNPSVVEEGASGILDQLEGLFPD